MGRVKAVELCRQASKQQIEVVGRSTTVISFYNKITASGSQDTQRCAKATAACTGHTDAQQENSDQLADPRLDALTAHAC